MQQQQGSLSGRLSSLLRRSENNTASAPSSSAPAASSAAAGTEPSSGLLPFPDPWELLDTHEVTFEKVLAPTDSVNLNFLRELESLRRSTCGKQSSIRDAVDANHLQRLAWLHPKLSPVSDEAEHVQTCPHSHARAEAHTTRTHTHTHNTHTH